ncbi:unnamed protein product [Rhizophagus irregularis]|nr:unnamed protein product [Rhizophagus irregularis]
MGNEQSSDGKSDKNIKNERSSDDEKDNTAIEQSRGTLSTACLGTGIGMKVVGSLIENKRNGRSRRNNSIKCRNRRLFLKDINKIQQIIFV